MRSQDTELLIAQHLFRYNCAKFGYINLWFLHQSEGSSNLPCSSFIGNNLSARYRCTSVIADACGENCVCSTSPNISLILSYIDKPSLKGSLDVIVLVDGGDADLMT